MDVFVIDDDAANRELLGLIVESAGHAPRLFHDVDEPIEALEAGATTDAVVTDLAVGPTRDGGYRLIAHLRNDARTRDVAIVVVTGVTGPQDLARARSLGADLCLPKPIDLDAFIEALRVLERARQF